MGHYFLCSWCNKFSTQRWFCMLFLVIVTHYLLQDYSATSNHKKHKPASSRTKTTLLGKNLSNRKEEAHERQRVFTMIRPQYVVGVLTSEKYLSSRAMDVYNTWGKEHKNISFFIGETNFTVKSPLPLTVLKGAEDDEYPPQSKGFRLLQYWCEHQLEQFDWFIKCDDDTYVKNFLLKRLLLTLDPKQQYYIGRPGYGIPTEITKLGLYGNSFCCGPTVIYSRPLLKDLCPHLKSCLHNVTTAHEDTEIGRCVIFNLGYQCANTNSTPSLGRLFFQTYEGDTFSSNLTWSTRFRPAITVHAIKESSLMFNLHYYYKAWLRKFKDKLQRNLSAIYKKNPLQIRQVKAIYQPVLLD